jgi:hypothetical protein
MLLSCLEALSGCTNNLLCVPNASALKILNPKFPVCSKDPSSRSVQVLRLAGKLANSQAIPRSLSLPKLKRPGDETSEGQQRRVRDKLHQNSRQGRQAGSETWDNQRFTTRSNRPDNTNDSTLTNPARRLSFFFSFFYLSSSSFLLSFILTSSLPLHLHPSTILGAPHGTSRKASSQPFECPSAPFDHGPSFSTNPTGYAIRRLESNPSRYPHTADEDQSLDVVLDIPATLPPTSTPGFPGLYGTVRLCSNEHQDIHRRRPLN